MVILTAYDRLLARRTVSLGVALTLLALALMFGTDDGASTFAGRIGRLAALVSLAGGGGAFIATEQARSRGEMRALGAAGVPPVKAAMGAVVGGTALGALGPVLALLPSVDLTPLFPRVVPSGMDWVRQGDAWLDVARGTVVRATGELARVAVAVPPSIADRPVDRAATALALIFAALAFPLWATATSSALRRASVGLAVAAAAVGVFHLVAVHRVSALALAVPPAALLLDAAFLHRRASWQ